MALTERDAHFIGYPCALGGASEGSAYGPERLAFELADSGFPFAFAFAQPNETHARQTRLERIANHCASLRSLVLDSLGAGQLPIVIGGDHTSAIGSIGALAQFSFERHGKAPGVLWLDAHLDAHTPQSSHSGNPHGMPVACLFGSGYPELASGKLLDGSSFFHIGARSFEDSELRNLRSFGVQPLLMEQCAQLSARETALLCAGALSRAPLWGATLDLDAIDPDEFAAVDCPEPGGLSFAFTLEVFIELKALIGPPALLEISEYNPSRDPEAELAPFVLELIHALR